jgi:hypothetical protein
MATNKVRVFISSKQSEFEAERAVLAHEIEAIPLLEAVWAEQWAPTAATPVEVYLKDVRTCPIYLALFGRTYSEHTRREYEAACENPYREKLLYIKQCSDLQPELQQLIQELMETHTMVRFNNIGDLVQVFSKHLLTALGRMIDLLQLLGEPKPIAQGGGSVLERRHASKQQYLRELGLPGDLTEESNEEMIRQIRGQLAGADAVILNPMVPETSK